jgi:hypothetical protein
MIKIIAARLMEENEGPVNEFPPMFATPEIYNSGA